MHLSYLYRFRSVSSHFGDEGCQACPLSLGRGLDSRLSMKTNLVIMSAVSLLLVSCDGLSLSHRPTGGEEIARIADLLEKGRIDQAKNIVRTRIDAPISHFDPSSPDYCSESGIETRLNKMASAIAANMTKYAESDAVTRYAMAKGSIAAAFEQEDMLIETCSTNRGELLFAYTSIRRPIAEASEGVLMRLKEKAEASISGDLNAAVDAAMQQYSVDQRDERRKTCEAYRSEEASLSNNDPLEKRAREMILADCKARGL